MNQDELKKEIEKLDSFRSDCEGKMVTLSAALDEFITMVAALKAQLDLADAEKPKLRHGDWWFTFDGYVNMFMKEHSGEQRDFLARDDCILTNIGSDYHGETIQGNIFDDLKAQSKPLYKFTADVHHYGFDFKNFPQAPIQIAGNWHTLEEAKEISSKIQRVIFTAEKEAAK